MEKLDGQKSYLSQVQITPKGEFRGPNGTKYKIEIHRGNSVWEPGRDQAYKLGELCLQMLANKSDEVQELKGIHIDSTKVTQGSNRVVRVDDDSFQNFNAGIMKLISGGDWALDIKIIPEKKGWFQKIFGGLISRYRRRIVDQKIQQFNLSDADREKINNVGQSDEKFINNSIKFFNESSVLMQKFKKGELVSKDEVENFSRHHAKLMNEMTFAGVSDEGVQEVKKHGKEIFQHYDAQMKSFQTYDTNRKSYADRFVKVETDLWFNQEKKQKILDYPEFSKIAGNVLRDFVDEKDPTKRFAKFESDCQKIFKEIFPKGEYDANAAGDFTALVLVAADSYYGEFAKEVINLKKLVDENSISLGEGAEMALYMTFLTLEEVYLGKEFT